MIHLLSIFLASIFVLSGCAHKEPADLGTIKAEESEFKGSIDREAIRVVIRENIKQFETCYNQALKRNKDLFGKIVVQWDIVEAGKVEKAFVRESTVADQKMNNCMVDAFAKLTFPVPPNGQIAQVNYPFVFASGDELPKTIPEPTAPNEEVKTLLKEKPSVAQPIKKIAN